MVHTKILLCRPLLLNKVFNTELYDGRSLNRITVKHLQMKVTVVKETVFPFADKIEKEALFLA